MSESTSNERRHRMAYISKARVPQLTISIEYEDSDYTYISSAYPHKALKKDIETIKRPIKILWT